MQKPLYNAATRLIIYIIIAVVLGSVFGEVAWALVTALLIWACQHILEMNKLQLWLQQGLAKELPESTGSWGIIFDDLSRLRKKQRRREKDLRDIITRFQQSSAALQDAVVIINKQSNLEWWNRSAERLLGLKLSADKGKPIFNLLRDPRFIRYFRRGQFDDPLFMTSPHNTDIELQYLVTEFGQSDRLLVARDITHLVRLEKTRQDFVANASHELRTPLTVIRGYLETFLDQEIPAPLKRAMGQMQLQSSRMESLVEDLLLLSRLDSGEQIPDEYPINIQVTLQSIRESALILGKEKQQKIKLQLMPEMDLLGKENELHSAFSNLIYNAVRYTPSGGMINIRWWTDADGGYVEIADNGPGIDSIHLDRLTERFYRVDDDRSAITGGTGLGLAIVKNVLTRHGAQLFIDSQVGQGSTFRCHFPAEKIHPIKRLKDKQP